MRVAAGSAQQQDSEQASAGLVHAAGLHQAEERTCVKAGQRTVEPLAGGAHPSQTEKISP
jgi:hypothetical protein